MQLVYYDGGSLEKRANVEKVLQSFSFSYHLIEQKDISQTLGYLMQIDGYTRNENSITELSKEDLLIINDLDDETIQALSNALREANCHVERKAMLTIHNKDWTLFSLVNEICSEHAYFQSYDTLKQCIMKASELDKELYTQDSWSSYQQAFLHGYTLLQKEKVAKEQLDLSIEQINTTKDNLQLL